MRSFPEFEPERPARNGAAGADTPGRFVGETEHSEILEQVLRETLSLAEDDAALNAAELEALRDVARRRRGALSDTEATELAAAVLSTRWGRIIENSQRQRMARTIAETLLDDPRARERLEALWRRLCEAVQ